MSKVIEQREEMDRIVEALDNGRGLMCVVDLDNGGPYQDGFAVYVDNHTVTLYACEDGNFGVDHFEDCDALDVDIYDCIEEAFLRMVTHTIKEFNKAK